MSVIKKGMTECGMHDLALNPSDDGKDSGIIPEWSRLRQCLNDHAVGAIY